MAYRIPPPKPELWGHWDVEEEIANQLAKSIAEDFDEEMYKALLLGEYNEDLDNNFIEDDYET